MTGLVAISVVFGLLYGLVWVHRPPSWPRTVIKTLPVAALALIALALGAPAGVVAGLAFCALGDALLARPSEQAFLLGLVSFLVGHLAYAAVFWGLREGAAAAWVWPASVALVAVGVVVLRSIWAHLGTLRWAVVAYVAVIVTMGILSLGLAGQGILGLATLGALCFMASDSILAFDKFAPSPHPPTARRQAYAIWFLYWGANALITAGFVL